MLFGAGFDRLVLVGLGIGAHAVLGVNKVYACTGFGVVGMVLSMLLAWLSMCSSLPSVRSALTMLAATFNQVLPEVGVGLVVSGMTFLGAAYAMHGDRHR